MQAKINLPVCFMWCAITVMGLFSQYMRTDVLVYMFIAAVVVTVVK